MGPRTPQRDGSCNSCYVLGISSKAMLNVVGQKGREKYWYLCKDLNVTTLVDSLESFYLIRVAADIKPA